MTKFGREVGRAPAEKLYDESMAVAWKIYLLYLLL